MILQMDAFLAEKYANASQKARVVTEAWVGNNMFCPRCGNTYIAQFENNRPVADFYCPQCNNQFELKSKCGEHLEMVNDGAYSKMIERITDMDNPDFFFMSYLKPNWEVRNFFFVPKHFFTPEIIEKRKPLAPTAKRAGWTGCNIRVDKIPAAGRISIINNGVLMEKKNVMQETLRADNLVIESIHERGWLFDILTCVEKMPSITFTLSEIYRFENDLSAKHPDNNNVRAKIRQQLQILRDRGIIEFVRRGEYRKVI